MIAGLYRYAADYDKFSKEFAVNFKKLTELGFTESGLKWYETTMGQAAGVAAVAAVGALAMKKKEQ